MLSIIQQPASTLLSVGNDNIWTVSGNTFGAPNVFEYCYVADLYVNGVFVTSLKSFPDFQYGFGVFNLKNILQQFVGTDFFPTDNDTELIRPCPNSSAVIDIRFGEQFVSGTTVVILRPAVTIPPAPYTDSFGTFVSPAVISPAVTKSKPNFIQNKNVVSGSTSVAINASLSFPDSVNENLEDFLPVEDSTPLVLNDNPRLNSLTFEYVSNLILPAYTNQRQWLYVVNDGSLVGVVVFTFDNVGNNLGVYQINNDGDNPTFVQAVATGVPQLNLWNEDNSTDDGGFGYPVIGPTVAYYQVIPFWAGDSDSGIYEPVTYKVMVDCGRFSDTAYTIHWLNTLGGFNSWLFNKKNETTQQKTVQKYKKQYGTLNSDGSYSIATSDQINRPYYTVLQDTITMTTDFLSDSDVLYLKNLVSSPVVYMEDQNGLITAIEIVDDSYRVNKKVNQKIYSLQMNVKQSANNYRQQG